MDRSPTRTTPAADGRSVIVSVRMTMAERRHLDEDASRLGCSASELLRRLAGQAAGLGPVLSASDKRVLSDVTDQLSDVIDRLRDLGLRFDALERCVRQEGVVLLEPVLATIADAADAVRVLASLYASLARDGRRRVLGYPVLRDPIPGDAA
jgi:hypothetical protein